MFFRILAGVAWLAGGFFVRGEPVDPARLKRGQTLFIANCSMCHQVTGRGTAGVYPPLAASDYLTGADGRRRAVLAVVQGLSGRITVNGRTYDNQMAAVVLNDAAVSDVLTYVFNAWGNPGGTFSAEEVAGIRSESAFKTYDALVAATSYRPLPKAPEGFTLRELVRLPEFPVRLAADSRGGRLYVLHANGTVARVDIASKKLTNIFRAPDYVDASLGDPGALGMMLDASNRLWIAVNQRHDAGGALATNRVTLFRTAGVSSKGDPIQPKPWFQTAYPWGIGPYNHGVSQLSIGPDGRLYVASGSRTDGGEAGTDPRLGRMGETDITASLWRLDPEASEPALEVIARGLRNVWSFGWDGDGNLFSVSNGPDANACEEMDWIRPPGSGEAPRHHGFPYQFEDWPVDKAPYAHTPRAPEGVHFVHPVRNVGPAGKPSGRDGFTFDPHSSPAGMVWLDGRWPAPWKNRFLVGRFGNLLTADGNRDVGFDVLAVRLERAPAGDNWIAHTDTFLAPLARPIDLCVTGGRLYVLEYTRPTNFKEGLGWLPGRILELSPVMTSAGR
jgi:mono/diheme cytochrome c family protein